MQAAQALLAPVLPGQRIAVREVRVDEADVPARVAQQVEELLVSALNQVSAGTTTTIVTRSDFGKILGDAELLERDLQSNLDNRAQADGLVVTSVYRVPSGLMLSLQLYDLRPGRIGTVLSSTADHFVPIDLQTAFRTDATAAVNRVAVDLAPVLLEDAELLAARLRFVATDQAGLTGWLSSKLATSLATVVPKAREGLYIPIGQTTPPQIVILIRAKAQDQGREVLARFRLTRADGRFLAERATEITSESIPIGIRLEADTPTTSARTGPAGQYQETFLFEPRRTSLDRTTEGKLQLIGERFAGARDVQFLIESHAAYAGGTHDPRLTAELRAARVTQVLNRTGVTDRRIRTRLFPAPVLRGPEGESVKITYGVNVFQ